MNFWQVLGIEPTTDKTIIRHAYAEKTRACHPEENPQGFDALHKAFQAAMQYARRNAQSAVLPNPGFAAESLSDFASKLQENSEEEFEYDAARKLRLQQHQKRAKIVREKRRFVEQQVLLEYTKQMTAPKTQGIVLGLGQQEQGEQFDFAAIDLQQEEDTALPQHTLPQQAVLSHEERAWMNTPGTPDLDF